MSFSATGFGYLAPLIKNYYTDRMIKHVKLHRYLINWLEKYRQVEPMGQNAVVPVILAWAESVAPGSGTSVMPAALDPEGATLVVKAKHLYGMLMVWHTEQKHADKDFKAFIKAQQTKLEGLANAAKAEAEIYCYGDGGVTPRCVVSAAAAAGAIVTLTVDSTRLLRRGMPVDFFDANAGANIANGTYVQVRHILSETQFTVDVGAANSAAFALAAPNTGVYHANGRNQEPFGLEGLIGTANNTLFDVNRALPGNEWYIPLVRQIDAAGNLVPANGPSPIGTPARPWDMRYLYQVIEILESQRQAPKDKLAVFTTPSIRTKIVEDNRARGIAMPLTKKVDVWPEDTVEINGVPIIASYLSRPGAIFIPCLSTLTKYETDPLNWDEEGGLWKQAYDQATGRPIDAKYAYFREIYELAVGDATQSAAIYDCQGAY